MPEYTPSEEKRAKRIIRRWQNYFYPRYLFASCGLMLLIAIFTHKIAPLYYTLVFLFVISPLISWVAKWTVKPFIRRLSLGERELLERYSEYSTDKSPTTTVRDLLEANKVDFQKELLRASEKQDDDTLLRAANSTDNTPQEQLLRPSDTDNN